MSDQHPQDSSGQQPPSGIPPQQPAGWQGEPQQPTYDQQPPYFQADPPPRKSHRTRNVLFSILGGIVLLIAVVGGIAAATGGKKAAAAGSSSPGPAAAPSPTLNPQDQQFVTDMRTQFNFGNSVEDSDLAAFGEEICTDRQGSSPQTAEISLAESSWTNTPAGEADGMVRLAEQDICPGELPAQTVEYKVTGNAPTGYLPPTVTYGPAGSNASGSIPMDVTQTIPSSPPSYYAISAQLSDAGGSITCQILVDGAVISQATASGADNICDAEISSGLGSYWEDTNGG